MKERISVLAELANITEEIKLLNKEKSSIEQSVYNRAYTVREIAEDRRLEKEIDLKRKELEERRRKFAKTFLSREEISALMNELDKKQKESNTQDQSYYSVLKGILRDVDEDYKLLERQNAERKENSEEER